MIAGLVEDGGPKKAFQQGITSDDFETCEDEWRWLCEQAERHRPINRRRFQQAFPDFEWVVIDERVQDLIEDLKSERAYVSVASVVEQVSADLTPENALMMAEQLREVIAGVLRLHSPSSDVFLTSNWREHMQHVRNLRILHEQGVTPGIPTGVKNLDHHWGGLVNGRAVLILGRPGDAKSMFQAKLFVHSFLDGRKVAMFSPEMNEHEHRCRIATLLSAMPEIQEEVGLRKPFPNRALMEGHGFNEKDYKRFWQWAESQPGEMMLFTQKYRRVKMTPAYIESKVDDLGIEALFIDPIYKLKPGQRRQLKYEELADITDAICDMAEGFNIPVVMSNQANRQNGNRGDAPSKDQSFGADSPVQEADHVIGVRHFSEERKLRLRCTKNRFGGDFLVDLRFIPNYGRMEDITPVRGNYFSKEENDDQDVEDEIEESDAA